MNIWSTGGLLTKWCSSDSVGGFEVLILPFRARLSGRGEGLCSWSMVAEGAIEDCVEFGGGPRWQEDNRRGTERKGLRMR